jgi:hypothetical protein
MGSSANDSRLVRREVASGVDRRDGGPHHDAVTGIQGTPPIDPARDFWRGRRPPRTLWFVLASIVLVGLLFLISLRS